jgi:hypothetical protein
MTPLRGAAVQINAYNFPVWGMLEKLAPAFLAGVPSIAKPAGQTAYLTELVVRSIVDSGLLPEGSLQLLIGGTEGLVDALDGQDLLSFTGSAATGALLRAHPAVVQRNLRLNVEADSLNCAVLGLDAKPGTEEFDLFVREVVREMTAKAGQKCTAIRRAFVPREHLPAATRRCARRSASWRSGTRATRPPGWAPWSALRSATPSARRSAGSPGEGTSSPATRTPRSTGTSAVPSWSRCCCATTTRATPRCTTSRRSARSRRCCRTTPPPRSSS